MVDGNSRVASVGNSTIAATQVSSQGGRKTERITSGTLPGNPSAGGPCYYILGSLAMIGTGPRIVS